MAEQLKDFTIVVVGSSLAYRHVRAPSQDAVLDCAALQDMRERFPPEEGDPSWLVVPGRLGIEELASIDWEVGSCVGSPHEERPVMVCTEKRGVFFGYATETSGDVIHLRAARMAVYWSAAMRGVLGLAKDGPDSGCRISKPADVELRGVTAVAEVSPEAAKRWEDAPWDS